ncbi:MAG: DUF421 domain-containing protein [Bacilli bacterium]|nr:DUF421 domain-containing protein [Bacilli bacterium]
MDFFYIFMKSIGSILALFFFTKAMGRKQVSQLNLYDYVIGITIGSVAAEISINFEAKFLNGLIVMGVYTIVSILIAHFTAKSMKLRRFVVGVPIIIIEDGKIIEDNVEKSKIDLSDLLQEARNNGYFDISEIEFAIMEANGKISFKPKSKYSPITPSDVKLKVPYEGLCSNLVVDGQIMSNNLKVIEKDDKWLLTRLRKEGYNHVEDLLLVTCDSKEKLTIYKKGEDSTKQGCLE